MAGEVPFTNLLGCNHHWPLCPCTDADPPHGDGPHVDISHNEDPHEFISAHPGDSVPAPDAEKCAAGRTVEVWPGTRPLGRRTGRSARTSSSSSSCRLRP